jgi:phosphatidylserine decarboxylase
MIRQIAGAVARRIVTYSKENDEVHQGGELGFIKFGSRVDIFLPLGTEVEIPILQQVKANKTIIAKL